MPDLYQSLAECIPPHLLREVERELILGFDMQRVNAQKEAMQAAVYRNSNAARSVEGIGQLRMQIPRDAYHYWGQRLGYECWDDEQFLREFERDNPEVAVRNYAKKTVVNGAIFTADGFLT